MQSLCLFKLIFRRRARNMVGQTPTASPSHTPRTRYDGPRRHREDRNAGPFGVPDSAQPRPRHLGAGGLGWLLIILALGLFFRVLYINHPLQSDDTTLFYLASSYTPDQRSAGHTQHLLRLGVCARIAADAVERVPPLQKTKRFSADLEGPVPPGPVSGQFLDRLLAATFLHTITKDGEFLVTCYSAIIYDSTAEGIHYDRV